MDFYYLTLFPEMILGALKTSILGRAADEGYIGLEAFNIRDYTLDKHKRTDDSTYGGGAGMLMQAQPVYDAWKAVVAKAEAKRQGEQRADRRLRTVYMTPQGTPLTQRMAEEFAEEKELVILCGHYEGIDERVLEEIVTDYVSIGDYVLTGGELPAMVLTDAVARLVPGVLHNEASAQVESFHNDLLEYPQYSRPEVWNGKPVPPVLLTGDHKKIAEWRKEKAEQLTRLRRPDMYACYQEKQELIVRLMRNKLHHMNMLEVLRRGTAEILYGSENAAAVRDKVSGTCMLSAKTPQSAVKMFDFLEGKGVMPKAGQNCLYALHQRFLAEEMQRRNPQYVKGWAECIQMVYTRNIPPKPMNHVDIRELGMEYADKVEEWYSGMPDRKYLEERIRSHSMFGAFLDGELAGFAGIHAEGSMGMLEVAAPFRRRQVASALESSLIHFLLRQGRTPYCHVFTDNGASIALQEKLGLCPAKEAVYWLL